MQKQIKPFSKRFVLPLLVLLIAAGITINWLQHTPGDCYTKGMAVGSSVCHQLGSHSFTRDGIQFPVCARCSGLYLGCFIALLYYLTQGRKSGIPKRAFLLLALALTAAWGGDGLNSLISDFLGRPFLYTTNNTTRLVSGFGMGLVLATALAVLFNITIWKDPEKTALLRNPGQIGAYILASAGMGCLLVFGNSTIFQILTYLCVLTIVAVISILYTIFWVILLKKENTFESIKPAAIYFVAGFASALVQITIMSSLRNWLL